MVQVKLHWLILTGLLKPTSGKILLDDKDISEFIYSYQNFIFVQDLFNG